MDPGGRNPPWKSCGRPSHTDILAGTRFEGFHGAGPANISEAAASERTSQRRRERGAGRSGCRRGGVGRLCAGGDPVELPPLHEQLWSRFEHEDYSVARSNWAVAAVVSSAIEIAFRVLDQTSLGVTPVFAACETVQHRLRAGRIHLEHNSLARCAAVGSSAIKIARRVSDQTSKGVRPVRPPGEAIQHRLGSGGIQPEHYAGEANTV